MQKRRDALTGYVYGFVSVSTGSEGIGHEQAHLHRRTRCRHPRRVGILRLSLTDGDKLDRAWRAVEI